MNQTFTLLIILSSLLTHAQKWCEPGATWFYSFAGDSYHSNHKLYYEKDTVLNNQACKKINGIIKHTQYGPPWTPPIITFSNYVESIYTYAQNDTVFIFNEGIFKSVYYFSAFKGDTIDFDNLYCQDTPLIVHIVDSTGVMNVNGEDLRFFIVHSTNGESNPPTPEYLTIVEKFGALKTFMYPDDFCSTEGPYISLTCYKDLQIGEYAIEPYKCFDFTSTNEIFSEALQISPNPVYNKLSISTKTNEIIESMTVTDLNGRTLLINKGKGNYTEEIMVEDLSSGLYILEITVKNGNRYLRKFVKN